MASNLGTAATGGSTNRVPPHGLRVRSNITIMRTAADIYYFWRNPDNLAKFIDQLESVAVSSDDKFQWVQKVVKGQKPVIWPSEIVEDEPGSLLSWRTAGAEDVEHVGTVRFQELPYNRGTVVDVEVLFRNHGNKLTDMLEKAVGKSPVHNLEKSLIQLRDLLENGETPTIEGQPHGDLH